MAVGIRAVKPKIARLTTSDLVTVGTTVTKLPDIPCFEVELMAHPSNTGTIWVGYKEDLEADKGWILTPGQTITIPISNVGLLWAKADAADQKLLLFANRAVTKYVPYYVGVVRPHPYYEFMSPFTDFDWKTPGYDYRRTWTFPFLLNRSYSIFLNAKLLWRYDTVKGLYGTPRFITTADINGDGVPEVITASYRELHIRIFDLRTGNLIKEKYLDNGQTTSLTVYDIDMDGYYEIIVTSSSNKIHVYHFHSDTVESYDVSYFPSALIVSDIDKDSKQEILVSVYKTDTYEYLNYAKYPDLNAFIYSLSIGCLCDSTRGQCCYIPKRDIFLYAGPWTSLGFNPPAPFWEGYMWIGFGRTGSRIYSRSLATAYYRNCGPKTVVKSNGYMFIADDVVSGLAVYDETNKKGWRVYNPSDYRTCSNITQVYDGKWKAVYLLQHATSTSDHILRVYDPEENVYTDYSMTIPGVPEEYIRQYADNPCSLITVFPTNDPKEFALIMTYPDYNKLVVKVLNKNFSEISSLSFALPHTELYSASSVITWYGGKLYLISAVTRAVYKVKSGQTLPYVEESNYGSLVCIEFG